MNCNTTHYRANSSSVPGDPTAVKTNTEVQAAVVQALRYYALFHYPLTAAEVHGNCTLLCSPEEVNCALADLLDAGIVYSQSGFFSSSQNIGFLVERRRKGNELALKKIPNACATGKLIYRFPFVRFVGISGSLSKGYAEAGSDYDFFVVTSANRLWVCRTILHLFKKLTFLFGQEQKFCMNYFLDETRPALEEQNIYTAIELESLIPVAGDLNYMKLLYANHWVKNHLPNGYTRFYPTGTIYSKASKIKAVAEKVLNAGGSSLNKWLMEFTDKMWRRKWSRRNFPASEYDLAFKTTLYHSKNHPANYQKKILDSLNS